MEQPNFSGNLSSGLYCKFTGKNFDSYVLISGKQAGIGTVANPDAYTRKVVVDNIVNMISTVP